MIDPMAGFAVDDLASVSLLERQPVLKIACRLQPQPHEAEGAVADVGFVDGDFDASHSTQGRSMATINSPSSEPRA